MPAAGRPAPADPSAVTHPGESVTAPVEKAPPTRQAERLVELLHARGLLADVYREYQHKKYPIVRVVSAPGPHKTVVEYIYLAPDGWDWYFWWRSLDLICPIREVEQAAEDIAAYLWLVVRGLAEPIPPDSDPSE